MLLCSKLLPQATWCLLPCPALPAKPLAGGVCVNLTQVCFYQAEGLLNEVAEQVDRVQGCQALLLGQRRISAFQHSSLDAFGSLDRRVPHVDGDPFSNVSRLPPSCFSVRGPRVPVSSPSACDDVPALLCRWWFSPEDSQVDVGGAVRVVPSDRPFDEHSCHLWIDLIARGDLLCQGITPATFFLHQRPPESLLSST